MIFSHVLYQLSYLGVPIGKAVAYRRKANPESTPRPRRLLTPHFRVNSLTR